jgi:hypothetical protein
MVCSRPPNRGCEDIIMNESTCAACDCELDANAFEVTIGGRRVEVCCEQCAQKLCESDADTHRSS